MVEIHMPKKRDVILGIDNGLSGGIVAIDEDNNVVLKELMPVFGKKKRKYDVAEIVKILKSVNPKLVILEKVQSMGRMSSKQSMLSLGFCYGMLAGICETLGYPYVVVAPKEWQGKVFKGMEKNDTKTMSVLFAKRMSPDTDWKASDRCKNYHDGLTDSYCMAIYGKMTYYDIKASQSN